MFSKAFRKNFFITMLSLFIITFIAFIGVFLYRDTHNLSLEVSSIIFKILFFTEIILFALYYVILFPAFKIICYIKLCYLLVEKEYTKAKILSGKLKRVDNNRFNTFDCIICCYLGEVKEFYNLYSKKLFEDAVPYKICMDFLTRNKIDDKSISIALKYQKNENIKQLLLWLFQIQNNEYKDIVDFEYKNLNDEFFEMVYLYAINKYACGDKKVISKLHEELDIYIEKLNYKGFFEN